MQPPTEPPRFDRNGRPVGYRTMPPWVDPNGEKRLAAAQIAQTIVEQNMSIRDACIAHGVSYASLYNWRMANAEIGSMIDAALEGRVSYLIEEIIDLAESTPKTKVDIAHTKLKIWAREKAALLLLPRRFKIATDVTSDGEKLAPPVNVDVRIQQIINTALERRANGEQPMIDITPPSAEELMK